jgi:hypothetical protein
MAKPKSSLNHRPILREKIREVLSLLPEGRRADLVMIMTGANKLLVDDVVAKASTAKVEEVQSALGWLLDRGQVSFLRNATLERDEYHITMTGRQAMQD